MAKEHVQYAGYCIGHFHEGSPILNNWTSATGWDMNLGQVDPWEPCHILSIITLGHLRPALLEGKF